MNSIFVHLSVSTVKRRVVLTGQIPNIGLSVLASGNRAMLRQFMVFSTPSTAHTRTPQRPESEYFLSLCSPHISLVERRQPGSGKGRTVSAGSVPQGLLGPDMQMEVGWLLCLTSIKRYFPSARQLSGPAHLLFLQGGSRSRLAMENFSS